MDEKLQTCDSKSKQYGKLLEGTAYEPSFIFLLNDWFTKPEYDDVKNTFAVLAVIISTNSLCQQ